MFGIYSKQFYAAQKLRLYCSFAVTTFASAVLSDPPVTGGGAIHSSTGHLMRVGEVAMNFKVEQEGGNST